MQIKVGDKVRLKPEDELKEILFKRGYFTAEQTATLLADKEGVVNEIDDDLVIILINTLPYALRMEMIREVIPCRN